MMKQTDNKYKQCSCEHCGRNSNNFSGQFVKYDNKVYCIKHYRQLKKYGHIIDLKPSVYGIGINDMPYGWTSKNKKENIRIYELWSKMLQRCYSNNENVREKYKTYNDCCVCDRWLYLSNFVKDIQYIDGYQLWLNNPNKHISLDKDIKSNGKNKCYCLEECMFVEQKDNSKQTHNQYINYFNSLKKENHPRSRKIWQYDLNGKLIKPEPWECIELAAESIGTTSSNIILVCKYYENQNEYFKKYKKKHLSAGGYIWKYVKEE